MQLGVTADLWVRMAILGHPWTFSSFLGSFLHEMPRCLRWGVLQVPVNLSLLRVCVCYFFLLWCSRRSHDMYLELWTTTGLSLFVGGAVSGWEVVVVGPMVVW